MFSNILHNQNNSKSHEGIELDTDSSKKLYTTYVPQDVLENEIYNHTKTFVEIPHNADLNFAQKFIDKEGKFIYCADKNDLKEKLIHFLSMNNLTRAFVWEDSIVRLMKDEQFPSHLKIDRVIDSTNVAISFCEGLVSDEGTIILNPNQNRFRPLDNFPEYHIILSSKGQIKLNMDHAVSDFILKHQEVFPFIIDISKEEKSTRFALNKPILISRGTKRIFIFYCEECCFE